MVGYIKKVKIADTASSPTELITLPSVIASLVHGGIILDDRDLVSSEPSVLLGLREWNIAVVMNQPSNTLLSLLMVNWFNRIPLDVQYLPDGVDGFQGRALIESFNVNGEPGGLSQAVLLLTSDGPLQSTTQPILESWLSIGLPPGGPDVIWSGGSSHPSFQSGDFDGALQQAVQNTPVDGFLMIRSGSYDGVAEGNWMIRNAPGTLTIIGEDPDNWPVINGGVGNWFVEGNLAWLHVRYMEIVGKILGLRQKQGVDVAGLAVQDALIRDSTQTGISSGDADNEMEVILQDVSLKRLGTGNQKHNIYLSTRGGGISAPGVGGAKLRALRVDSRAANNSIAFKTQIPNVHIKDCYLSTVNDWGNPTVGPKSSSLLDIVACGEHLIEGTTFECTKVGTNSTRMLHWRARKSILACDMPNYEDSPDFFNPEFWNGIGDHTDPNNNMLFRHTVRNCDFIYHPEVPGADPDSSPAITDDGTYPRWSEPFTDISTYGIVIPEWNERSVTFRQNLTYTNIAEEDKFLGDFNAPQLQDGSPLEGQLPGSQYPPPNRTAVDI
jgi:hypothetical protein